MTDPIADMLTRIRNASRIKKAEVYVPFSKIKLEIVKILKQTGYVKGFEEVKEEHKFGGINIVLKYEDGKPAMTSLKKISKPGRRVYAAKDEIPRVLNGLGLAILSTSRGIMTDGQARKAGVGGEVICEIY
ncbi:MAG: 30S ribosomal protein S8 [Patescibacteria group bacterium]